jgi:hypothetical protein
VQEKQPTTTNNNNHQQQCQLEKKETSSRRGTGNGMAAIWQKCRLAESIFDQNSGKVGAPTMDVKMRSGHSKCNKGGHALTNLNI